MKKRWLLNILLLLVVASLVAFLYIRPKPEDVASDEFEVSAFKLAEFNQVNIHFPARSAVKFAKVDGFWRMQAPHDTRADQASVQRILSIIAAKTKTKILPKANQQFSQDEQEKFGLKNPRIKLNLVRADGSEETFLFGTFNPITDEQYVEHAKAIYLLPVNYAEAASTQVIELVDKAPLQPQEKISAFDFSHLEQWEASRLKMKLLDGKWDVSIKKAQPTQNELNEWVAYFWEQSQAQSVKFYQPDLREQHPHLTVIMKDGKRVKFDKLQESPNLLLARPDEGIIYQYPADEGFTMLNPPINMPSE